MQTYQITAWWNVQQGARSMIEAESPEAAMAELKRRIEETDWICDNESFDNSDGPTNLEVAEEPGYIVVAEELSDYERMAQAAPDLLAACILALRNGNVLIPEQISAIEQAIAKAKG